MPQWMSLPSLCELLLPIHLGKCYRKYSSWPKNLDQSNSLLQKNYLSINEIITLKIESRVFIWKHIVYKWPFNDSQQKQFQNLLKNIYETISWFELWNNKEIY